MARMLTRQGWNAYGPCGWCDAEPGKPCVDLRYARRTGEFFINLPHPKREKV